MTLKSQYNEEEQLELLITTLQIWRDQFNSIEYEEKVSDKQKLEKILNAVYRFILVRYLESFEILPPRHLQEEWKKICTRFENKEERIIQEFLNTISISLEKYFDLSLLKNNVLSKIIKEHYNLKLLFKLFDLIIGENDCKEVFKEKRNGIYQFDFKKIDIDVLGKVYEIYLGSFKNEQGIFYTPREVTRFIVENTVGKKFQAKIKEFERLLKKGHIKQANKILDEIKSFTILDPACGSGAFLVESFRVIWGCYKRILNLSEKYNWDDFNRQFKFSNNREMAFKIILRHLYGVDLDHIAINATKLNLTLEMMKLCSKWYKIHAFREDEYLNVLDLRMNLKYGNTLLSYPISDTLNHLQINYQKEVEELNLLRKFYHNNPNEPHNMAQLLHIINSIKESINKKYERFLGQKGFSSKLMTLDPFHWGLEFWFIFMDNSQGFDFVIGNPPYLSADTMAKLFDRSYVSYLKHKYEKVIIKGSKPDLYIFFIHAAFELCKKEFGFIVPNRILSNRVTLNLRKYLLESHVLRALVNFDHSLRIFQEPELHPCLLFLSKNHKKDTYQAKFVRSDYRKLLFEKEFEEISYQNCQKYNVFFDQEVKSRILEKLSHLRTLKGVIHEGLRGDKISKEKYLHVSDKKNYIPEYRGKNVRAYHIDGFQGYFYYPQMQQTRDRIKYREKRILTNYAMQLYPKLVIPELAEEIRAALDPKGWIAYGGIYFISKKECDIPLRKLLLLFNSKMFNYLYSFLYESGSWGNSLKFRAKYLEEIPIPNNFKEESFYPIVLHKIKKIIVETYNKLKEGKISEISLKDFLMERKLLHITENRDKIKEFHFTGNPLTSKIIISGIDESEEKVIQEIEIHDKELMQIIYFSLSELFNSRKNIEKIEDVLLKAMIPIFNQERHQDFKYVIRELQNILSYSNIIKIDTMIRDMQNQIDAYIFRQYELSYEDVETVLTSLGIRKSIKEGILAYFKNGKKR